MNSLSTIQFYQFKRFKKHRIRLTKISLNVEQINDVIKMYGSIPLKNIASNIFVSLYKLRLNLVLMKEQGLV